MSEMTNKKKDVQVCSFPVVKVHLAGLWTVITLGIPVVIAMFGFLVRLDERSENTDKNVSYMIGRMDGQIMVSSDSTKTEIIRFPDDIKGIKKLKTKIAQSPINNLDKIYPVLVEVEDEDD